MKDTKLHSYIPGPGRYDSNKSMLEQRTSSLRPKLPDNTNKHLVKVSNISYRILDPDLINLRR